MKRYRLLYVTPEVFVDLCKPGPPRFVEVAENPLPPDASWVRYGYDCQRNAIQLIVESEAFEPVAEGAHIPQHPTVELRVVQSEPEEAATAPPPYVW